MSYKGVGRDALSEKVTYEQRPDGNERGRGFDIQEKSNQGQENSLCKCPEAEKHTESSRNGKKAGTE